jgi:hypothetical protein
MAKKITVDDLRIHVSGNFLCEELPNKFSKLSGEELEVFLTDYAWEPLEDCTGSELWDYINDAALSLKGFLKSKGIKVTGD